MVKNRNEKEGEPKNILKEQNSTKTLSSDRYIDLCNKVYNALIEL